MNTTEKKMAAAILRFEDDRVTGPASLRVSRLPAADKGGKWEICGICDGFEPAVFNLLKALLDAGKQKKPGKAVFNIFWTIPPPSVPGLVLTPIRALSSSCGTIISIPAARTPGRYCSEP